MEIFGCASNKCGNDMIVYKKNFTHLWNVLCAVITKHISMGKLVKEVNGITAQSANKVLRILLILFITADKLNQKKFKWFYRLIGRRAAASASVP